MRSRSRPGGRKTAPARRQVEPCPRLKVPVWKPSVEGLDDRVLPSFLAPVNSAVGSFPDAVAVGDFNHDGVPDLAVANNGSGTVSVLLGNGDGTFQPARDSAAGPYPHSLAVGDFNADGKLDVAVAVSGDVNVLAGNGDGTFQAPAGVGLGSDPASLAVGDFNADGKLDMGVTSNVYYPGSYYYGWYGWYWTPGYYTGNAGVLLGNGDGSFASPGTTWLGYGYHTGAAVADFNGDGKQDFAAADTDYGTVSVLPGDGAGNLSGPTDFYAGGSPGAVAAGDVNGDGKADLVAATYSGTVGVLLGDGSGGFGPAHTYPTGSYPTAVALADFNHDGKPDVVTSDYYDAGVAVVLGRGDGTFSPPLTAAAGPGPGGVAAGDFDGDGWADAATANLYGGNASVLINDHAWPAADAPSASVGDVTVAEGNDGTVGATFTVSLSAAYDQPVAVHYATADGTATAGSDYTAVSGDITFAPGETTKTVTVVVYGDKKKEPDEWFAVDLSNPSSNALVSDPRGIGWILDDDHHGKGHP